MRRTRFAAVLLAAAAFAQTPPPANDKPATVEGTVTNSVTSEPLLRAHVMLRGNTTAGKQVRYGAITDTSGKFSVTGLPPGTYSAQVEHTGFVAGSLGWPAAGLNLGAGDAKSNLKLQLTPFGSITGRVLDPNGDPVEWVQVIAEGSNGPVGTSGGTDDHGVFRIGGLRPGKYRVKAVPQMRGVPIETRSDGTVEQHNLATYHPSGTSAQSAARVGVQAGAEAAGIDIRLAQGPIVRVSGVVRDMPENARVNIEVRTGATTYGAPQVKPDGSFSVWRLDPGTYTVSAYCVTAGRNTMRSAPVQIEVGGVNLEHVDLRLLPPSDIAGRVEYDGEEARAGKQSLVLEDFDRRVSVPLAGIGSDNTFKLESVPAGRYRIRVAPGPTYVKAVRLGQTTTEGSVLDLRNGMATSVTMVLSSDMGSVTGSVMEENIAAAGARVALLPEDPESGLYATLTMATASGAYAFQGIRPGRYKLVALDAADDRGLDDVDDRVEHIEVSPNDRLIQDLSVPSAFQIGIRR